MILALDIPFNARDRPHAECWRKCRDRAQVAGSLTSSLNPGAEARPPLAGPGQTLNLASTFAAAAAKADAVQPDLAPQVLDPAVNAC